MAIIEESVAVRFDSFKDVLDFIRDENKGGYNEVTYVGHYVEYDEQTGKMTITIGDITVCLDEKQCRPHDFRGVKYIRR